MKKPVKIVFISVLVVGFIIGSGLLYLNLAFPKSAPPEIVTVESSPLRIQRGKYLANNVASCVDCHSLRDWSKFTAPITKGTDGGGGEVFDATVGFPGTVAVKNITPAAVGSWTDVELIRAITCGVTKDNRALFPMMPYPNYNKLTKEDLYSIIAYMRTLQPIDNSIPKTDLDFPVNLIVKTLPLKNMFRQNQ